MSSSNDQFVDHVIPQDTDLKRIAALAVDFVKQSREIEDLETELANRKKMFKTLSEEVLPSAMNAVNMKEFTLSNGYKIGIKDIFIVRIPKGKIDFADDWLHENGHDGMIRRKLAVDLPREMNPTDLKVIQTFFDTRRLSYSVVKETHWATIQSWANEARANGEVIPEEIFSVYVGNQAVITE